MPLGTLIEFTLYGDDDEVKAVYRRARVPVMFVERALEIGNLLNKSEVAPQNFIALYQFVVDFYKEKFTIEDVRRGSTTSELLSIIEAITTAAAELMPDSKNPPPPPG